ncbi:hypothetical protein [Streptomyces iconiensis]|uniref:Uncharacterized protein n=1 Tax=Streptomyces iconiensis TaxID=1384038 RepID=A0ABT6ZY54_9ACTN|nr:hypothetical protein [Streptomyces iconiensis]MDJ1133994.1 hypothetical protein [Streptomyces iconiensis]
MQKWNRRRALTAGGALGAALLTGVGTARGAGTAHGAGPSTTRPGARPGPLEIVTGEDGFTFPSSAPRGTTTFRSVSTSATCGFIGLARLRGGHGEEAFSGLLRTIFTSQVPQETIRATRELMATAELFGGAAVHPGVVSYFTSELEPGRYLLLEYRDFQSDLGRNPAPGQEYVRTLTVRDGPRARADGAVGADSADGSGGTAGRPRCSATLRAVHTSEGPRFVLRGTARAGRPLRYVNSVPEQPDEAIIYRVDDDAVTEKDVQAFFDGTAPPPFAIASPLGTPPLSPGEGVTLTMPTEPGRYVAVSWVGSVKDAQPMARHGQHLLFRVR